MSFTISVKQELCRVSRERACCRTAELAALFRAAGSFHILPDEKYGLHASFGLSATARTAVSLVRAFDLPVEVRVREERRLAQGKRYEIYLEGSDRLVQFLNETGILSDKLTLQESVPHRIIKWLCCKAAFLRGAFLAAGSISEPGSPAHLEVYSHNYGFLMTLVELSRESGLELSLVGRKRNPAVYSKRLKSIRNFLVLTGAHRAALELEEQSIISAVRAAANRRANFDQANAARCSRAAARQVKAIEKLKRMGMFESLSTGLVEVAELRLEHDSLTIGELGRRADPPLSKSAVNHRLRRLVERAEKL